MGRLLEGTTEDRKVRWGGRVAISAVACSLHYRYYDSFKRYQTFVLSKVATPRCFRKAVLVHEAEKESHACSESFLSNTRLG